MTITFLHHRNAQFGRSILLLFKTCLICALLMSWPTAWSQEDPGRHIIGDIYPFKQFPPRGDPLGAWVDREGWNEHFGGMYEDPDTYIQRRGLMARNDRWYPLWQGQVPPYTYQITADAWNGAEPGDTEKAILWTAYYTRVTCAVPWWRPWCDWANEAWQLLMAGNNPEQVLSLIGMPPTRPYKDFSFPCAGPEPIDRVNAALERLNPRQPMSADDMSTLVCGWYAIPLPNDATCSFRSWDARARIIAMPSPFARAEEELAVDDPDNVFLSSERRYLIFEPILREITVADETRLIVDGFQLKGDAPLTFSWRTAAQAFVCDPRQIAGLRAADQILTFALNVVPFGGTAHYITFEKDSIFKTSRGWITMLGDVGGSLTLVGSALKSTRLLMTGLTADAGAIAVKVGAVIHEGEIRASDVGQLTLMIGAFGLGVYTAKNYYLDRDFAISSRYADAPAQEQMRYRLWARDQANRTYERSGHEEIRDVLNHVAQARRQYGNIASSETHLLSDGLMQGGRPGVVRTNPDQRLVTPIPENSPHWASANRDLSPETIRVVGVEITVPIRVVRYDGDEISALAKLDMVAAQQINQRLNTNYYRANQILVFHAPVADIPLFRGATLSRLKQASESARPMAARKEDFAKAMYTYYAAVFYEKGSAGIGRSYFAGLYRRIFGRKMRDIPEVDLIAITSLDEAEFLSRILPHL